MKQQIKKTARHLLSQLPESIQKTTINYYAKSKINQIDRLITPKTLTIFITNRCNERCDHCFHWQELNTPTAELSLEEIERLAHSLHKPASISFTGGEPFIRKDLPQVVQRFNQINNCRTFGIASNATLKNQTVQSCLEILETCDIDQLAVQVSIDGLNETHNRIRRVPQAFDRTMETLTALVSLRDKFPHFKPAVNFCILKENHNEIESFIKTLRPLNIPIRFTIVRGNSYGTYALPADVQAGIDPKETHCAELTIEELEAAYRLIDHLDRGAHGGFWTETERQKIQTTLRMIRTGQRQLPCYNGRLEAVVYANGDFAMCELTKPIGNLRNYDMDVREIWKSKAAQEMRKKISGCYCIHGCSIVTSLGLQPDILHKKVLELPTTQQPLKYRG